MKERKETTPLSWWSVLECGREELLYCGEEMIGNVLLLFFAGVEVWRCVEGVKQKEMRMILEMMTNPEYRTSYALSKNLSKNLHFFEHFIRRGVELSRWTKFKL